jgi:23S rRNA (uracil1939-C5)-methyltransferase
LARKRELPVLFNAEISSIGSEGNAIARVDNQVVFVPMAIPGDILDIRVTRKRKNYMEGVPIRFHRYSPLRITPRCSHFGVCGGCKWQHLPYSEQLKVKEQQVKDSLQRIAKTELPEISPIKGSENVFYYRNKLEFTFSNRRWLTAEEVKTAGKIEQENALGFHIPGLFDKVLAIDECFLQPEPSNRIRNSVREFTRNKGLEYYDFREQKGFLRNMIVRNTSTGGLMVVMVFGADRREEIESVLKHTSDTFPEITSLIYIINTKRNDTINDLEPVTWKGEPFITERLGSLEFRVGPKSFYQTNTLQASQLYRLTAEMAGLTGKETVYDLYTGTGTIACYIAGLASRVIGIEYVPEAVEDARVNAGLNGLSNVSFFAGDMKNILSSQFFELNGKPDVIITDPPRAGMHEDVVKAILISGAGKIVYVSCNPATQARDIAILSERYSVTAVQPVDMFPHTHHVENIVQLTLR